MVGVRVFQPLAGLSRGTSRLPSSLRYPMRPRGRNGVSPTKDISQIGALLAVRRRSPTHRTSYLVASDEVQSLKVRFPRVSKILHDSNQKGG